MSGPESLYDAWWTAIGRDGFCAVQRASADPRGVALARMCEAAEGDRDWLPGWDGTRWRARAAQVAAITGLRLR